MFSTLDFYETVCCCSGTCISFPNGRARETDCGRKFTHRRGCRATQKLAQFEYTLFKSGNSHTWNSDTFSFIENVTDRMRDGEEQDPVPLIDCVHLFRSTKASDPRDKICAFPSISHSRIDSLAAALVPNYTLTARQVYMQAAEFMIQADGNLGLLSTAEDSSLRRIADLPSWVPDFSTSCYPVPFSRHASLSF
jgi:hypothetical protein